MIVLLQPLSVSLLSRHQHQYQQMIVLQQPRRKGILRGPDQAMSEPGEAKLLDAVAMLTLNLESERRTAARDQNGQS